MLLSSTSSPFKQTVYNNYKLVREVPLPEIQSTLFEIIHEPTAATILHLNCEDDENLFCLSFQTRPSSSDGVAHILEHTVLCGSKHFPVRDPFFSMSRRSLNTFMNALTGADFTCYPASSQISKDFYNLLQVYLDAVFHPLLDKRSFQQEGHRLEFEKPNDTTSPLMIKGVVYNEMKGALSSPDARLGEFLMEALFPALTYGVNSGGDPKTIPQLTYEGLKSFHREYYHPSRALFFFYGNLPIKEHLDFLEKNCFKGVVPKTPLPALPKQPRFSFPLFKEEKYPLSEGEDKSAEKTLVGMGWLTCSILSQLEILALSALEILLMGTDASPLKMALLKSGLCKQADSALEHEMSEVPFILICKGCEKSSAKPIVDLIYQTLKEVVQKGFDPELIEGAVHQMEMSRFEITGNSSPYGLSLFFRSALLLQHGGKPEEGLLIHSLFETLREKVKDPSYLPSLIYTYLLENPHFVCIELNPDPSLQKKEHEEEGLYLKRIKEKLTHNEIEAIVHDAKALEHYQESKENENILPKVTLKDIPKQGKEFVLKTDRIGPWDLFYHPCFTNDIVYADLIFDLPDLDESELADIRLFTLLLSQIGCGGRNYQEHLDYILKHTGGIGASLDLCQLASNPHEMRPCLMIRGKSLGRKVPYLFPLFKDLLTAPDFTDKGRLEELLMQHFNAVESGIQNHPLRYAINLASSGDSVPSKILNDWYGLNYFQKLKEIVSDFKKNSFLFIERMQVCAEKCLGLANGHLVLSCSEQRVEEIIQKDLYGLIDIAQKPFKKWHPKYQLPQVASQGRLISSSVAFNTWMLPSISYLHPDAADLSLASEIMENEILHKQIREKGGAYGASAVCSLLSSQFYFYSYRDPHLSHTIKAFKEAIEKTSKGTFKDKEIEEAKLGMIQELDSPCAPGSRAMLSYLRLRTGRTPEMRQQFRERLLAASHDSIQKAVKLHLVPYLDKGVVVSFAGKELFDKEKKKYPLPTYTLAHP